MTYDEARAYERFEDGEITLDDFAEVLINNGHDPRQVRLMLSENIKYPIPVGYFGKE